MPKRRPKLVPGELYTLNVKDETDWASELMSFHHADRSQEDIERGILVCAKIDLGVPMLYLGVSLEDGRAKKSWQDISHKWLITNESWGPHEVCCFNSSLKRFLVTHVKTPST